MLSTERRNISQTESHYGVEMVLAIREHVAEASPEDTSEQANWRVASEQYASWFGLMAHMSHGPIMNATMAFWCAK